MENIVLQLQELQKLLQDARRTDKFTIDWLKTIVLEMDARKSRQETVENRLHNTLTALISKSPKRKHSAQHYLAKTKFTPSGKVLLTYGQLQKLIIKVIEDKP